MSERLAQFNRRLSEAFARRDHHVSHLESGPILREMAADPKVLHDILEHNLNAPGFFERLRINPVLALEVGQDSCYSLIGHCWLPLDDSRTDLTHQSVHHHGKLLLTSMSAWGLGYESVLFKAGFEVVGQNGETAMEIDKIYKNPRGHLEFVGPDIPHVVMFPSDFTVTYALWSRARPQTSAALVKRIPGVQAYKKKIKAALQKLGIASGLGLNVVEKLDFYPRDGKLIQMHERVNYRAGSAENFVQNYFWCLQQAGFERFGAIATRIRQAGGHPQAAALLAQLERGDQIERRMESIHLGVEKVQFGRRELLDCFGQPFRSGVQAPAHQAG